MTTNTLPAHDVAFLTALAEFLLASGSDRAADAICSAIEPADAPQPVGEWAEVFVR